MRRRDFLKLAALGAGAVGVTSVAGCSIFAPRQAMNTFGQVTFDTPLPVPPILEANNVGGRQVFDMTIQEGISQIVPQGGTTTWGLNGPMLGPTIRANRGDDVRINVTNDMPQMTSMHWHGMRLPSAADGGPHSPIENGDTWSPEWTIDQPGATLWYHPHPHGETEIHVYMGLGGFFIVDDGEEPDEIPHDYGVDDFPVIIQDKTFDENGELEVTERFGVGMLGDTILANGAAGAELQVTAEKTRLRLLNGSTARTYNFGLSDDSTFQMIASDGGLLPEPIDLNRIMLSPGERAEIVVEMVADETVVLRSFTQDLGINSGRTTDSGGNDELDIMQLRSAPELSPSPALPAALAAAPALQETQSSQTRQFSLGNNVINNRPMDMDRIDFEVPGDATEIWEIQNTDSQPHNFHIHDVQFQILDIDGQEPPAELAGWKDTIYTPPGARFRLLMEFHDNPTPEIPYMYHCHLLWHEDEGMMGQFVVGDLDGAEPVTHDH